MLRPIVLLTAPSHRYGDKLIALDDGNGRCCDFVDAAINVVAELATLVKIVSIRCQCCDLHLFS
jgi:hypothetical protein